MNTRIYTGSLRGLKASLVAIETDVSPGLPALNVVGLPDAIVREAKERVRAALVNSGFDFPQSRITINLAPAALKKQGSHFDLPLALSILENRGDIKKEIPKNAAFLGELSLDGMLCPIEGALPLVIGLREQGIKRFYLPAENLAEASVVRDVELMPASTLSEVVSHLNGKCGLGPADVSDFTVTLPREAAVDFSEVYGQEDMKRVLTIAAAGYHGLVMLGPPGAGKTMLARRLPTILPPLSYEEMLECTQIYSIAGKLSPERPVIRERPFRAPHHSATAVSILGGGVRPRPGELSLAHNGVLFLDELPEFGSRAIEMLRQPIEEGYVNIARFGGNLSFPSRCILIAASNPCRCGYYGDKRHRCTCSQSAVDAYMNKLSGPLLERLDLQIEVRPVEYKEMMKAGLGIGEAAGFAISSGEPAEEERNEAGAAKRKVKSSADMRKEVEAAIEVQKERYKGSGIRFNSQLANADIERYCRLNTESRELMEKVFDRLALSARTYNKVLKVARTIADLSGGGDIETAHVAEALSYRQLDKRRAGR